MQEPYKGLRPYEEQDQENFFGREAEKQVLVDKILANKLTLLFAASGVGKSSLLQAAVIPQLRCVEGKTLDVVYHKNWFAHPIADLKHTLSNALRQGRKSQAYKGVDEKLSLADFLSDCTLFTSVPFILVLDQFEEFFTSRYNLAHREEFVEQLAEAIQDRDTETIFVIAMREDFAMEMDVFRKFLPSIFDNLYRLKKLSLENARNAIVAPLTRLGFQYEPALLEELLKDLGSREQEERSAESVVLPQNLILSVEPPHLQIICLQLWEAEQGNSQRTITQVLYHHRGRAKGLLKSYFLKRMTQFSAPEKRMASRTFDVLVSQYGTKSARPLNELAKVVEVSEAVLAPVLDKLDQARVLRLQTRHSELWYELYHDVFAEHVVTWNEEYKNQQRWYKVLQWTGTGFALSVLLVVGYDTWMNAVNHHFRLSVKAGISDTIEVWQGKKGSWDRWGQQTFHYETDYGRGDLEVDKLFVQRSVEELANLQQELIGSFPLAERLSAYRDDGGAYRDQTGKLGVALCLVTASISPYRREVSMKMIDELRDLRSVAGFNTLAELVIQAPNDELRQEAQNMLESTYSPPTVWRPWLQKSHTKVHNLAVIAFGKLGYQEVVPELIDLLKDSYSTIRRSAIEALSQLGAQEAIPQITDLLKDSDWQIRRSAIYALSELRAREAIPQITDLLKDLDVRWAVIEALSQLGAREAIPQIIDLLKDSDSEVRWRVIDALSQFGAREAIPQLTDWLKDSNSSVRSSAIEALSQLGAREAIPQLTDLLKDSDSEVRWNAIYALSQLGVRETIPQLTDLLKDSNSSVRSRAIYALSQLGTREAIPQLTDWLKDSDSEVRSSAIKALSQLGAREAIPQLTALLKDSDWQVRRSAIEALSQLGAREVIPQIMDSLKDSDSEVRGSAVEALSQLGAREAIPQITDLLKDSDWSDWQILRSAIDALSQLGAQEAIPQITNFLKDSDAIVRSNAIEALSELGAREAIPQLTDLLKDSEPEVRSDVAAALGHFHQQQALPKKILAQISNLLQSPNLYAQSGAAEALSQVYRYSPPDLKEVPYERLLTLLQDPVFHIRQHAVQALQALGTQQALPALRPLLQYPNTSVRWATVGALIALKEPNAVEHLMSLLKSFKVEADVLTTLAGQEEAWQTFLTQLHTQTPSMKIKVLTAVTDKVFAPLTSAGFAQFLSFLEDPDATVRWQAMRQCH